MKLLISFQKKIQLTQKNRIRIDSCMHSETTVYNRENFTEIQSVAKDFDFFLQEKWKIALDRPGSGNTKNIGSELDINKLKMGNGLFKRNFGNNGKKVFDNYWINYETPDMARKVGRDKPRFKNIATYSEWIESLKS